MRKLQYSYVVYIECLPAICASNEMGQATAATIRENPM